MYFNNKRIRIYALIREKFLHQIVNHDPYLIDLILRIQIKERNRSQLKNSIEKKIKTKIKKNLKLLL